MSVFDVDRHVIEPQRLWRDQLPSEYLGDAPAWQSPGRGAEVASARLERLGERALLPTPDVLAVRGRPVWRGLSEPARIELGLVAERRQAALRAAETAEGHLAHMARTGITASILLPTYAAYLVYDDAAAPALSRAYAAAYNRWMSDLCRGSAGKLSGAALLSRSDPDAMVGDLEEGLRLGLSSAVVRPEPVRGRTLSAPAYDDFWAACASASVAVLVHGGTHARVPTAGAARFSSHFGQHVCSHPLEAMMAVVSLLEGGVLVRHPSLRVGFLECGCGWLPHWLGRLDAMWQYCRGELRDVLERPPSELVREQCFFAVDPGEALLPETVAALGVEPFVFGSDYPHLDHGTDISAEVARLHERLGPRVASQILEGNPRRLLGGALRAA